MKNLVLISMILAIYIFSACEQEADNVPAKVKTAFEQKFPDAKKVKWEKENEQEWEAEFKMKGIEYSANFDINGSWKETEYEIKKSEIPAAIKTTLESEFADYKIEEAEVSETKEAKVYEVELEKNESEIEVVFTADGKIIKQKEEKEHDEEKDKD